ncbi:MAG: sigma-70 family RNA polymerase sigma factor [Terrimicrobiaceae bacterium]
MQTPPENHVVSDDRELMEGLLQRLPEALERLHRRYRALLRSVVMQVLHDDSEADDVLQEVFLQVWNRAESYSSGKGKLVSWLCTLARRRAIDRLRQHSAYRRATGRYEVSCNHADKELDEIHTVEREAYHDDLRALLQRHLNALPPSQEQVIRMAFLENRSHREISTLTKTPLGTVKTRIELGIKKLTNAFEVLRAEMA